MAVFVIEPALMSSGLTTYCLVQVVDEPADGAASEPKFGDRAEDASQVNGVPPSILSSATVNAGPAGTLLVLITVYVYVIVWPSV